VLSLDPHSSKARDANTGEKPRRRRRVFAWRDKLALFLLLALPMSCRFVKPTNTLAPIPTAESTIGIGTAPITPTMPSPSSLPASETPSPSPTPLPAGMFLIQVLAWPETGSLLLPMDIEVTFQSSLANLPPGDYVIFADWRTEDIRYASLSSDARGTLASGLDRERVGAPLPASKGNLSGGKMIDSYFVRSGTPTTRYVFDLMRGASWRVGPLCDDFNLLSPEGRWFVTFCKEGEQAQSLRLGALELIEVDSGAGYRITVPGLGGTPQVFWLDEDTILLASRFYDLGMDGSSVCIVRLSAKTFHCPSGFEDRQILSVSPDKTLLALLDESYTPRAHGLIAPNTCLQAGQSCAGVDLGWDSPTFWSPDSASLLGGTGDGVLTEFTLLRGPDWLPPTRIAQFGGSYLALDWCPDSTCLILGHDGQGYRLDLDGTVTRLAYDYPIGAIRIP